MNKDKQMKDLKELNHKLKHEYELLEIRNESTQRKNDDLQKRVSELEYTIGCINQFIKDRIVYYCDGEFAIPYPLEKDDIAELLNIINNSKEEKGKQLNRRGK